MTTKIMLVGCGKMGQAMLTGWLENGISRTNVVIVEPGPADMLQDLAAGCSIVSNVGEIAPDFVPDVIILAVKPQMMDLVTPQYSELVSKGAAILSIAAGTTVDYFENVYGDSASIVRSMPNTPAAIGRGMLVGYANANVSDNQKEICHFLLEAVGKVAWIDDETHMDAVTGLSGSGPAYIFYMIECMTAAGIEAGLPKALALMLAETTVAGAGELARQSEESAEILRQNVTSPNGTTAAGLEVLMSSNGLKPLMTKTVEAATRRSRELG